MDFRSYRMLLTIMVIVMWPLASTLDIKTAMSEACGQEKIISAIMENKENKSTAFVFSGHNVWTMDIATGDLLEVERTSTSPVFQKNVTDIIQVALEDRFKYMYYLMGRKEAYIVFIDKYSKPMKVDELLGQWAANYNFERITDGVLPTCGAAYLKNTWESVLVGIFPNGKIYQCPKLYAKNDTHSIDSCKQNIEFKNPNNVPASELDFKTCEGLLIDEGDEPWEDPGSIAKVDVEPVNEANYRMLFADDQTLRLWKGTGKGNLKYTKDLRELFNCKYSSTAVFFIVSSIVVFIVIVVVLGLLAILIIGRRSRRQMLDEPTISQYRMTTQGKTTVYNTTQNAKTDTKTRQTEKTLKGEKSPKAEKSPRAEVTFKSVISRTEVSKDEMTAKREN